MQTGRELDALVAERVMGWTQIHRMNQVEDFCGVPPRGMPPYVLLCYSTDIAAAFQVVDKLLDGTRTFSLECWSIKGDNWRAMFKGEFDEKIPGWDRLDYAYAETRPLAICHAALKVIAEEKKSCES